MILDHGALDIRNRGDAAALADRQLQPTHVGQITCAQRAMGFRSSTNDIINVQIVEP